MDLTLTLHLSDEATQQVAAVASARGETPAATIAALVEQTFSPGTVSDLLTAAEHQAALLRDRPRAELFAELRALRAEILQQAVAQGTTVEDWPLDE